MTYKTSQHPAEAYVGYYEALSNDTISDLPVVAHTDIHFKDPFNDVRGIAAYKVLLEDMLRVVPDIRFKVLHCAYDGDTCFLHWNCRGTVNVLGSALFSVNGTSILQFADDGRIISHFDHWDSGSQFYERIPVVGSLIRFIRRRVSSHSAG